MQTESHDAIVEVLQEVSIDVCNAYLDFGYKFLSVGERKDWMPATKEIKDSTNGRVVGWNRSTVYFYVGRPDGVSLPDPDELKKRVRLHRESRRGRMPKNQSDSDTD